MLQKAQAMKVLIVYAHPEPRSLNGSLKNLAVKVLQDEGHEVIVSDLYQMQWKTAGDGYDFLARESERLSFTRDSKHAFQTSTLSPDIQNEIEKLLWSDAVIFQFPLWWFSMPAILKGWFDRVYVNGFAYGVGQHGGDRWGDRYGEGKLLGRRAMLSITIGGREKHYSPRGVNGYLHDLLFPIQHGILYYPGMTVLEPFVIYQSDRLSEEGWNHHSQLFTHRLRNLFVEKPIPFRKQNAGHYDAEQVLKPGLGHGAFGTGIHLVQTGEPQEQY